MRQKERAHERIHLSVAQESQRVFQLVLAQHTKVTGSRLYSAN
jgi:hypothetical protein